MSPFARTLVQDHSCNLGGFTRKPSGTTEPGRVRPHEHHSTPKLLKRLFWGEMSERPGNRASLFERQPMTDFEEVLQKPEDVYEVSQSHGQTGRCKLHSPLCPGLGKFSATLLPARAF